MCNQELKSVPTLTQNFAINMTENSRTRFLMNGND